MTASQDKELKDINKARAKVGLPPLQPGPVECLMCHQTFESWARAYNRICPRCKRLTSDEPTTVDLSDICTDVDVASSLNEIDLWRTNPRSRHKREIYRHGHQIVDLEEDHLHLFDPDHENDYLCDEEEEEDECLA